MSYCRWSTDDFTCDIYAYEDCSGGWTIHVAGSKHVGDCPKVDWASFLSDKITPEEIDAQVKAQHDWLGKCERRDLDLEHAGESFNEPTLEAFKGRMLALREIGYRFPDHVLATIDEEMAETIG